MVRSALAKSSADFPSLRQLTKTHRVRRTRRESEPATAQRRRHGDYAENIYVARAIAKLICFRIADGEKYSYQPQIKVLSWNKRTKGIDDALLRKRLICSISIEQWFRSLSENCQREIKPFLFGDGNAARFNLAPSG